MGGYFIVVDFHQGGSATQILSREQSGFIKCMIETYLGGVWVTIRLRLTCIWLINLGPIKQCLSSNNTCQYVETILFRILYLLFLLRCNFLLKTLLGCNIFKIVFEKFQYSLIF